MSSAQEINVETVKVPRTKKPSLSGKYSKFLSFGFWFVNQFDGLEQEVRDAMYSRMKLFDTVDAQSEFFQAFLDDIKPSNKLMRAAITAHNKPPKAPRAPKEPKEPKEPKAKKTKGKSAAEAVEAHVDQLVADLANTAQAETAQAEPAPKKTKKTKAAKTETVQAETAQAETVQAEAETLQSEPVAETTNETQPVQKKTKKAKAAKKTKNSEVAPPQNEEADLETRIIRISDTEQYLIDNENRLYDMESHVEIGFFDTNTNAVHLM